MLNVFLLQGIDMQQTVFVLTQEYNDYDQYGEYFVAVYANKPSHQELSKQGVPQNRLRHVLNGGGRKEWEDVWFWLRELPLEK
jgi:hypothetical protein